MLAFFRCIRSNLDSIIWISPGLYAVAAFPAFSSNSTVMTFSAYATIILARIWIHASLCKAASKGMIILSLAVISMPFLSTMVIAQALRFSLDLQQQTIASADMASLCRTLLTLMLIVTGYALLRAAFYLPAAKKPPSRSKQDVLRRGAMIVLAIAAAPVVLPVFYIVQQVGIGQ